MTEKSSRERQRAALLALAHTRFSDVKIGEETFRVREVEAETFAAYAVFLGTSKDGKDSKAKRTQAFALVLSECVVDESGEPYLSKDEALQIAGTARVAFPLINRILEISGFSDREKKGD